MRSEEYIEIGIGLLLCILAVITLFSPWFKIETTRTYVITNGTGIAAYYKLGGIVRVHMPSANSSDSILVTFHINDLPDDKGKSHLLGVFANTYYLIVAGLVFILLAFIPVLISKVVPLTIFLKLKVYSNYIILVAGIFFLAAQIYFSAEVPTALANLHSLMPAEIMQLPGKYISGLYGTIDILCYGPAFGWYLSFVTFMISLAYSRILRIIKGSSAKP